MIFQNSPADRPKSNGIVESASQAVHAGHGQNVAQFSRRKMVNEPRCPWTAEHAGFSLTRIEVGRDENSVREIKRNIGKSAMDDVRGGAGGPLGKFTCMWEDGVYLGVKATTGEIIGRNRGGVWLTRTVLGARTRTISRRTASRPMEVS